MQDPNARQSAPGGSPMPQAPAPQGFPSGKPDPRMLDLFERAVDYTRDVLAEGAPQILAAMKLDPIKAATEFGVRALRQVARAADEAGSTLPPEVLMAAGVQVIKDLAAAAEANGLLPDGEEETFLREVLQQSIALFAQLDREDGLISDEDMAALSGAGGAQEAPPPAGMGALAAAAAPPQGMEG